MEAPGEGIKYKDRKIINMSIVIKDAIEGEDEILENGEWPTVPCYEVHSN